MFGRNEIIGRKYFENAGDQLYVTSMFMTLQGEGPLRGEPAFFVRLAKCNLACSFCDTFFDGGDWFKPEDLEVEIDKRIDAYFKGDVPKWAQYLEGYKEKSGNTDHVPPGRGYAFIGDRDPDSESQLWVQSRARNMALVITGGEPMLQTNLGPFLEQVKHKFSKIQIESNGTVYQELPEKVILVVSPKCLEADGKPVRYTTPNQYALKRADCLKFVMEAGEWKEVRNLGVKSFPGRHIVNLTPYASIPEWAHHWREATGKPIFISPMNVYNREPLKSKQMRAVKDNLTLEDRTEEEVVSFWEPGLLNMEANQRNHEWAAKYCVQHGLTFNVQTHLLASLA